MHIDIFKQSACALLRTSVGWQTKIAKKLEVEPRTVRRWVQAGETPEWVEVKLAQLMGMTSLNTVWPRDEWTFGDTFTERGRRSYIVHLQPPRFVARVVALDDDGSPEKSEMPADIASGVVFTDSSQALCEIAWIDEPKAGEVTGLMEAALDWLESYDANVHDIDL